ncbi:MAG: hypothetical protein L5655_05660 [Thermosediminibacteraceae bacterium]|nr:hypothetical protein [Thermosediminibacteraceae bacterium]
MLDKKFWKRGSGEIVAFVLILPFLILPIANTVYMLTDLTKYDVLRQAAREAILRMEIEGGMTADALYSLEAFLQSKGIDLSKVHIDYTPYPVPYGEEVKIRIAMDTVIRRYSITLGGIKRVDENVQMVYGPISSVSKKYER